MRKLLVLALALLSFPAFAEGRLADPYWTLLRAPDRSDEDKKSDEARKPLELLRFFQVKPGMKVADLAAGGGYLTELLVRAVGPGGKVYAQNPKVVVEKFAKEEWPARLARPVNKDVVRVEREMDDPLPPDVTDLDLATLGFFYHDAVWLGVDRAKMNHKVFEALKPGGLYVIMDHAGRDGTGAADAKTLHRIEEKVVVDEVTKAGFKVARRGDFLRNKEDPRDGNVFGPLRGKTDRFVIAFVKPAAK